MTQITAKAAAVDPLNLAFSADAKTRLDTQRPQFQTDVGKRGQALAAQTDASKKLYAQGAKLRMYVSHFFQNLNFGIEREVFDASDRAYYQLDVSQTTLPNMDSEADLLMWAGRAVSGEAARTAAGGFAMPFPSAAEVDAELTAYNSLRADQSTKKDAYDAAQEDVEALRDGVDALIRDIWDEVEFTYRHEKPSSLRRKAREYGVVYMRRTGEPPEENGGEVTELETIPYNTAVVGTGTAIWLAVGSGLADIQTLVLIQGGTPFFTAFSPTPGTVAKTTWPGIEISGAIDEVKIQNSAGEDIAVGVFDPTLPDPAP